MPKWLIAFGALLSLQPLAAAEPVAAQQVAADPFEQLLDAFQGSVPEELVVESSVRALETTLRLDPRFAAFERQRPGIVELVSEAARPTLALFNARVKAEYRPRFIAAMRQGLTAEEALQIVSFTETRIGRKVFAAAVGSYDGRATATALAQGEAVTSTQVRQDSGAASEAALASLDEADRAELEREARSRPALLKLGSVRAEFAELRARMGKEPMTADETAMLTSAIQAALTNR
jgi:hypothetical protein